jgi:hypothetical protein
MSGSKKVSRKYASKLAINGAFEDVIAAAMSPNSKGKEVKKTVKKSKKQG